MKLYIFISACFVSFLDSSDFISAAPHRSLGLKQPTCEFNLPTILLKELLFNKEQYGEIPSCYSDEHQVGVTCFAVAGSAVFLPAVSPCTDGIWSITTSQGCTDLDDDTSGTQNYQTNGPQLLFCPPAGESATIQFPVVAHEGSPYADLTNVQSIACGECPSDSDSTSTRMACTVNIPTTIYSYGKEPWAGPLAHWGYCSPAEGQEGIITCIAQPISLVPLPKDSPCDDGVWSITTSHGCTEVNQGKVYGEDDNFTLADNYGPWLDCDSRGSASVSFIGMLSEGLKVYTLSPLQSIGCGSCPSQEK